MEKYMPTDKEITALKRLAEKQAAYAVHPKNLERREQWKKLHSLEAQRPLLLCEFGWHEISHEFVCRNPLLRAWEEQISQVVYRFEHVGDDALVPAEFPMQWRVNAENSHDGHNLERKYSGEDTGSYAFAPLIGDIDRLAEEVAKLQHESLTIDREASEEAFALAADIFGGILPPRMHYVPNHHKWTLGLGYDAVHIVGYNEFIMALCDNPEGIHALMAFLRDEWLTTLDFMEKERLLTPDWGSANGLSDVTPSGDISKATAAGTGDLWGFAECQEMVVASPAMFEEFIMPYVAPIANRFGYLSYGCCEPLDDRLDIVERYIHNVRKIGVTAWANQELYADKGRRLVLSRRPNPALVCSRFNEDEIRADLRQSLNILGGCQMEFMMKDIATLQGELWRIPRWVEIAREEISRYYGE